MLEICIARKNVALYGYLRIATSAHVGTGQRRTTEFLSLHLHHRIKAPRDANEHDEAQQHTESGMWIGSISADPMCPNHSDQISGFQKLISQTSHVDPLMTQAQGVRFDSSKK